MNIFTPAFNDSLISIFFDMICQSDIKFSRIIFGSRSRRKFVSELAKTKFGNRLKYCDIYKKINSSFFVDITFN